MLKSINGKQTMLKICRALVSMTCEIAPEVYEDFVTYKNINNKILLLNALKSLHRMLTTLILSYQKFAGDRSEIRHVMYS